ncbi:MAG: hypothetical protein U0805_16195 [Pirellulales bacterium]
MSKKKSTSRSKAIRNKHAQTPQMTAKGARRRAKDRVVVNDEDAGRDPLSQKKEKEQNLLGNKITTLTPPLSGKVQASRRPKSLRSEPLLIAVKKRQLRKIVDPDTEHLYINPVAIETERETKNNWGILNLDAISFPKECKRLLGFLEGAEVDAINLLQLRNTIDARLAETSGDSAIAPAKGGKKGAGRRLDVQHAKDILATARRVSALTVRSKMRLAVGESGMTLEQIGVKMGYSAADARQEVSRLIDTRELLDPRVETVIAFAQALERNPQSFLSLDAK